MLFDLPHVLYIVISSVITIGLLILFGFTIKKESQKEFILKLFALLTVILHFSSVYVSFFQTGQAKVDDTMLFPIYPCNVAMWLLVIVAFWKNKQSKGFMIIAEFVFYLGIVGSIIGIVFNENYAGNPNLANWDILKGLLSHSTMMVGCIYLLTGRFIKIRVKNVISVFLGLLFLLIDGGIIIGLYKLANMTPPNCMYLLETPFENMPWINVGTIGLAGLLIVFITSAIVEAICVPKEQRWYNNLRNLRRKKDE